MKNYAEKTAILSRKSGIVDVHTHGSGIDFSNFIRGKYPCCQDLTDLFQKGCACGVAHQVVFPMPTSCYFDIPEYWNRGVFKPTGYCEFPFQIENDYLIKNIEALQFMEDYFLPFLAFSLRDKIGMQIESLLKMVSGKTKIWGLKYHTSVDQRSVLYLEIEHVFLDFAKEFNLPFMIHTGFNECADPIKLFDVASRNPEIRFCAAHFGGFSSKFAALLDNYDYDNIYIDTSGLFPLCDSMNSGKYVGVLDIDYSNPQAVLQYYIDRFPNRILWGSDSPWYNACNLSENSPSRTIRVYGQDLDFLGGHNLDIVSRNSQKFLLGTKE